MKILIAFILLALDSFGAASFGSSPGSGGGSAPVGTVVNTGASVAGQVPVYSDSTGTNINPKTIGIAILGGPISFSGIITNIINTNLLSGDVDLYTIPTSYIGIILSADRYNTTNATVTFYDEVKISGSYYRLLANATIASTNLSTASPPNSRYAFNAGQTIAVNLSIGGTTLRYSVLLLSTNTGIRGAFLTSVSNGDNTLFTAPSTRSSVILATGIGAFGGAIVNYNNSGGTQVYKIYAVENGDSPTELNAIHFVSSTANATATGTINSPVWVSPGGSCVVNSTSGAATQYMWCMVMDY